MLENFVATLKQKKLATKDGIADFVKNTDFDSKIINNKNVTSNKTKILEVEKELNHLSAESKLISTEPLIKDLIN